MAIRILLLVALVVVSPFLAISSSQPKRPNFVVLISDDTRFFNLTPDAVGKPSSYAAVNVSTESLLPNLLRLAKNGVFFTNAHAQMALCSPSRASLFTGLRPDTTKLYYVHTKMRSAQVKGGLETIAEGLKNSGYETFAYGKALDPRSTAGNTQDYPRSWSEPVFALPGQVWEPNATATNCGYSGDRLIEPSKNLTPFAQCLIDDLANPKQAFGKRIALMDEIHANRALEKIDSLAERHGQDPNDTAPFFLVWGSFRPHLPFVVPQHHYARFNRSNFPFQWGINSKRDSVFNRGVSRNSEPASFSGWKVYARGQIFPTPAVHSQFVHGYYAACSYVDELIGMLVDRVRSYKSLVNNTIFIILSDHGFHLGEHQFYAKHTVYESATGVPLLFFGPEKYLPVQNRVIHTPVELLDIAPTVYELAGLPPRLSHDGESLVPLLRPKNPVQRVKTIAMSQYYGLLGLRNLLMIYSMRGDRYRYVVHTCRRRKIVLNQELYDYVTDPMEKRDIKKMPSTAKVLARFRWLIQKSLKDPKGYKVAIAMNNTMIV